MTVLRTGSRRPRMWRLGAVAALGVGGVIAAIELSTGHGDSQTPALCRGGDLQLTAIWNPDVAKRVGQAVRESKSPLADSTWRRTDRILTQYTNEWRDTHRRTCEEASHGGGEDSVSLLDRKLDCLSDRLGVLRAVVAGLEHPDAPMLEQAPAMLQLLPRVNACEDINQIAQFPPPPPENKRVAVEATRRKLAEASATIVAGRYQEGLSAANEAWQAANATGYFPVLAEAYLWVGIAHGRLGHPRESEQALEQAVSSATAGHAQDLAVRAWIQLMHFVGFEGRRYDDGYRYAEYAKAAIESMPGAVELDVERLSWLRAMLLDQKRYDEALVASRQELALVELRLGGSHHHLAIALDGQAGALSGRCKAHDALEPQQRACAILEEEFGSPHPQLALCLGNLASLHAKLGAHQRSLAIKERALSMFTILPGHPNHVAMAHRNMVRSLLALGRLDEALEQLQAAAPLSKSASAEVAVSILRGELGQRQGNSAGALEDFTIAVDKTRNSALPQRIEPLLLLAEANMDIGRFSEAVALARQAAEVARTVYGDGVCQVAGPLRVQADALVQSGRAHEALPIAERAMAALADAQVDPLIRARAEFTVAQALPNESRDRARQLAHSARDAARGKGGDAKLAARVERWIASNE